jgi:hypothetical protein
VVNAVRAWCGWGSRPPREAALANECHLVQILRKDFFKTDKPLLCWVKMVKGCTTLGQRRGEEVPSVSELKALPQKRPCSATSVTSFILIQLQFTPINVYLPCVAHARAVLDDWKQMRKLSPKVNIQSSATLCACACATSNSCQCQHDHRLVLKSKQPRRDWPGCQSVWPPAGCDVYGVRINAPSVSIPASESDIGVGN